MRLHLPVRRVVLFGALLVAALIATLPMGLVLGAIGTGLSAREVRGSIWRGELVEARAGAALLGDLAARLAPLPLLVGRARIELSRDGGETSGFHAIISTGGATRVVEAVNGTVPVSGLSTGIPLASLTFVDVSARFHDGRCDGAAGQLRATLSATTGETALPSTLAGTLRCDRGALLVPLASGAGSEGVTVSITADGRWTATGRLGRGAALPPLAGRLGGE